MEFGSREYRSYVLIDFNNASPTILGAFEKYIGKLDTFFRVVSAEYGVRLHPRETLFIFDEVQAFPKARQAIKYLVKDGRFDYIETGSLISICKNVADITIPSEETRIRLDPMDFEEFCWALGEYTICDYIRDCYNACEPLERGLHDSCMLLISQYMLVGGMPQSVVAYVDSGGSFRESEEQKKGIIELYRQDIGKIDSIYRAKVLSVFDMLPGHLSSHDKKVRFSSIPGGVRTEESYENTFFWLGDSMIVNECFRCTDPQIGFGMTGSTSSLKCYMNDTGLLFTMAFADTDDGAKEELYRQVNSGNLGFNKGMLYENMVAQMLRASGHRLFFYTHRDSDGKTDIEVDFLLSKTYPDRSVIIPVEVKSSKNYRTSSLKTFGKMFGKRVDKSVIIHPKNLSIHEDGTICIPIYMTFCL